MAVRGSYIPFKNTDQVQVHHFISHTAECTQRIAGPASAAVHMWEDDGLDYRVSCCADPCCLFQALVSSALQKRRAMIQQSTSDIVEAGNDPAIHE